MDEDEQHHNLYMISVFSDVGNTLHTKRRLLMAAERRRVPEVKTLYEMLPKGTEGGKEFARIVNLLLFYEARRDGRNITLFDDAAGDYCGLDSFEEGGILRRRTIGYQYKFFPSPLSSNHRGNIEKSLKRVAENQKKLKIKKWILVTPEDFVESSTRKDGGDVTWFKGLPEKLGVEFEIEHWGHTKVKSLFMETPSLCLYYYPELVHNGAALKKTIQDTRNRYNKNLDKLYHNIEFVGMSVYKPQAARGVPMEHIYIPLTVVHEGADETDSNISRVNPLSFLEPNMCDVVLGDPGSGKSTLLKFLALVGHSEPLQKRYKAEPDSRLPILITLRRYADELKTRKTLSLIDYIQEVIQGDFNLKSADLDFFEYYLENSQAILLFDGLDELPNPQYKKKVRDQIRTLITTYPGNTTVVTSRIVGYGSPFRFDEKEFNHYKLTPLQLPEIEQFVQDWYGIRIENEREREENANDLVRILRDKDQIAIRELAENPLLLTIIALVHRVDAVLPDERVVLYQKCTETLLITWHTWKFHAEEVRNRGKVERRNRRRMEEIAYWMHCQSVGTEENQRAVVPHKDLKRFLTQYIADVEKFREEDADPEDLADEFLDFVKKRAGLLIEIGDNQYSFAHLTFQEYLASSCILTRGEVRGVESIWNTIKGNCKDTRWHEVIRLLIAGLKSYESQEILVRRILEKTENSQDVMYPLLLGGFLLDGVPIKKDYQEKILYFLLRSASKAADIEQLRPILSRLRTWTAKPDSDEEILDSAFTSLWKTFSNDKEKVALLLVAPIMNWSNTKTNKLTEGFLHSKHEDAELYRFFLGEGSGFVPSPSLERKLTLFWAVEDFLSMSTIYSSLVTVAFEAAASSLESNIATKRVFEKQIVMLFSEGFYGSFFVHMVNILQIVEDVFPGIRKWALARDRTLARDLARDRDLARTLAWDQVLAWARDRARARALARDLARDRDLDLDWDLARDLARTLARDLARDLDLARARDLARTLDLARDLARDLDLIRDRKQDSEMGSWPIILSKLEFHGSILNILCDIFALEPRPQWREALRVHFLPSVPQRIKFFDQTTWEQVKTAFEKGKASKAEIYTAASLLLFDAGLYVFGYYTSKDESMFTHLADVTREVNVPPLCIAHCIRDLAYGDESRIEDFVSMAASDNPAYREIFEAAYWRPKSK
jgi:hypothetical protein